MSGGGEVTVRGNVSPGTGMYKSVDGGRSWQDMGLKQSRHIPRIRIHPHNPDVVYAAVLGDLFKDSEERGGFINPSMAVNRGSACCIPMAGRAL